jgi:beta-xylosidase
MTSRSRLCFTFALVLAAALGLAARPATSARAAGGPFLFSYFLDNGQDGLHFAYSRDGLKWSAVAGGQSFLAPAVGGKLMRDPCITLGPDGVYHMVWTTGWWNKGIGIAHSKDLVNWSEQAFLPVMADEPTAANSWAPEILYDAETKQYVIYWATTIPGRFPATEHAGDIRSSDGVELNHRIFRTTTRDFKSYTKSQVMYDPGFPVIDASILRDGARFVMFLKDETKRPDPHKTIHVAFADHALGPYGPASKPISIENWVEGPTAFRVGEDVYVLFDAYTRKRYEGLKSRDLVRWEPITDQLVTPPGIRHGTVFAVTEAALDTLLATKPAAVAK